MPELETMSKPKTAGFVDSKHNNANKRRIEEEQVEIDKLTATEEEATTEEPVEAKQEENLTPEEKTYKKRHTDARKYINEQDARIKALEQRLNNPEPTADIRPPKSDEDIGAWAEKYPDVAAIVETIAIKKAKEQSSGLEARVKEIDDMRDKANRDKAEVELMTAHPDFGSIRDDDQFHEWAEEQPKWIQDALYENDDDARSASRAIDLYKADKGIKTKKTGTSNRDAAKAVSKTNTRSEPSSEESGSIKESTVQKMNAHQYEKNADKIMEAIRSGKFIYDISGNAR